MEKAKLQELVTKNSERVVFKNKHGDSAVWTSFVCIELDGSAVDFVKCIKCSTVLKWKSRDGTSGLRSHVEFCSTLKLATNRRLADLPGISTFVKPTVPATVKNEVADVFVRMCATDIRPFSIAEGQGFAEFAQKLINIGHKYGVVSVAEVLPCATTISRHPDSVVMKEKATLQPSLASAVIVGVTADMWTSDKTRSYVTVTAHFLDCEWQLRSAILATRDAEEKHTAQYIRILVSGILEENSVDHKNVIYVTDNAANMKAAFREERWLGCSGHNLNLVLSHALQAPKEGTHGCPPEVLDLVTASKDLVTLAKKTRLNSKLETTLNQCVSARWNSVLFTLQSVQHNLVDLKFVASDPGANRNLMRLLGEINEDLLHDTLQLLLPFDHATKALSVDKSPSLHLVLPTKLRLQRHLSPVGSDCEVIAELRQHLQVQLDKYFAVSDLHVAASLLDPRLKDNTVVLSQKQRASASRTVREMMSNWQRETEDSSSNATNAQPQSVDQQEPPHKRPCLDLDFFGDLFTTSQTVSDDDELDQYLNSAAGDSPSLIDFWKGKTKSWPILSKVTKGLLGVPATSTSSERAFSLAGRTLEERWTQLSPHTLDGLLFLHGLK